MIKLEPLIAHRGASSYTPENTMAAFEKAIELGARAIEFDVMMCADGGLFVFHDERLERTSNGSGQFAAVSTEYIHTLDAGVWFSERFKGEKIPSLSEVLHWCLSHKIQANIEIKPLPDAVEATTTAFLACLKRHWPSKTSLPLVSSFNQEVLRMCAHVSPGLPLGVLFQHWQNDWLDMAKAVKAVSVHLSQFAVTRQRIDEIKKAGYKVCVYTVNLRESASRFFAWGADAVFSDYPDLMNE